MKNVLIITRSFPPKNNIAARRFGYMVRYMEEFGWKPWVVTVPSTGDLPVTISEDQIARIAVPNRSYRADNNAHSVWRGLRFRFDVLASSWYWSVTSNRQLVDRFPRPDIVLASYGPNSALWLGRYFSRRYGVPWIADFRDPGALRYSARTSLGSRIDSYAERAVLRSASAITTVGATWSEALAQHYDCPTETVYNGFEYKGDAVGTASGEAQPSASADYLYYAGTVYEHQLPAMQAVLDAIAHLPEIRLRVRLVGVKDAVDTITHWTATLPFAGRVELLPRCSAATALQEANSALCNLVLGDLMPNDNWTKGHITGKFLELVALKPAVLVVAKRNGEFDEVLSRTAKGEVCTDSGEVAGFLNSLQRGRSYEGKPSAVARYSKHEQCEVLCRFLDQFAG